MKPRRVTAQAQRIGTCESVRISSTSAPFRASPRAFACRRLEALPVERECRDDFHLSLVPLLLRPGDASFRTAPRRPISAFNRRPSPSLSLPSCVSNPPPGEGILCGKLKQEPNIHPGARHAAALPTLAWPQSRGPETPTIPDGTNFPIIWKFQKKYVTRRNRPERAYLII